MSIKVFADGAQLEGMLDMYRGGDVQGFTTNPSLMKAGGVVDYRAFAHTVLENIQELPVSFEVFADDLETMEAEAREIATWADNVYVKIPAMTTDGTSTSELVAKLSGDGVKVNVTTLFTVEQNHEFIDAVDANTPSIISIFAGRIADTGVDPLPIMEDAIAYAANKPACEILWASTRELLNIYQAEKIGCHIITVPNSILKKRKNVGMDLLEYSRETVQGFARDIQALGFTILP
ncbi:transaldolase [Collinsella sp. zg1085]|uniref:transaldolase n=1 Tax=Collinsella sp. zg1085 TaxID=2844380 RepID=UPI001C0AF6EE|nr:transaldolase [Collinsella sp. zg1085]QWT17990.1 transaldolase [Collinsella sp. zg1085]